MRALASTSAEQDKLNFLSRVSMAGTDECWTWNGARTVRGYGVYYSRSLRKSMRAHRMAYLFEFGAFNDSLLVCHKCDNASCVNPGHLWLGTYADNNHDRDSKGRTAMGDRHVSRTKPEVLARGSVNGMYTHPERRAKGSRNGKYTKPELTPRGERHGNAKLTDNMVRDIRRRYKEGDTLSALVASIGLSRSCIWSVIANKHWKHIKE